MPPQLEVDEIHAKLGGVPVLRGVSLSVDPGETVALIGRNGAGKTTTFRAIMGKVSITEGAIRVRGDDLEGTATNERSRIGLGFAPEDRRLFTDLTVADNIRIALWGKHGKISDGEFESVRERVTSTFPQVEEFLDRPAGQLSGGQQKMAAIGRALAAEPNLLLLDEPFEGLAPSVREDLRRGIDRIEEMDVSILIADSNVHHATQAANRFYVIERGETITQIDSPDGVADDEEIQRIFGQV